MEAETLGFAGRERAPITKRLLQQDESANDVGRDELRRAVDRTIDVAFRGQVQNDVWLEIGQRGSHLCRVSDIGTNKSEPRMILDRRQ
jgi:hypothetical protein